MKNGTKLLSLPLTEINFWPYLVGKTTRTTTRDLDLFVKKTLIDEAFGEQKPIWSVFVALEGAHDEIE